VKTPLQEKCDKRKSDFSRPAERGLPPQSFPSPVVIPEAAARRCPEPMNTQLKDWQ
jgi:hypothetical protein